MVVLAICQKVFPLKTIMFDHEDGQTAAAIAHLHTLSLSVYISRLTHSHTGELSVVTMHYQSAASDTTYRPILSRGARAGLMHARADMQKNIYSGAHTEGTHMQALVKSVQGNCTVGSTASAVLDPRQLSHSRQSSARSRPAAHTSTRALVQGAGGQTD